MYADELAAHPELLTLYDASSGLTVLTSISCMAVSSTDLWLSQSSKRVESDACIIASDEGPVAPTLEQHAAEVLTFEGDKICRTEVYFGWDLE